MKATDDAVITLVLGEVLTAPLAELPRTGSGSRNPLLAGTGLLLVGMASTMAARTRRRTA